MTLSDSERLIRIETLLQERCAICHKAQEDHETRIGELEAVEERRKGSAKALAALIAVSASIGGIIAKFLPIGR